MFLSALLSVLQSGEECVWYTSCVDMFHVSFTHHLSVSYVRCFTSYFTSCLCMLCENHGHIHHIIAFFFLVLLTCYVFKRGFSFFYLVCVCVFFNFHWFRLALSSSLFFFTVFCNEWLSFAFVSFIVPKEDSCSKYWWICLESIPSFMRCSVCA